MTSTSSQKNCSGIISDENSLEKDIHGGRKWDILDDSELLVLPLIYIEIPSKFNASSTRSCFTAQQIPVCQ